MAMLFHDPQFGLEFLGVIVVAVFILVHLTRPKTLKLKATPMTAQQFVTAIGIVESNGNVNSPLGDAGRAMGRFQMHPDWWDEWQPRSRIRAVIGDTWDTWQQRVLAWFFTYHPTYQPVILAMYYHLGHITQPTDPDWDPEYAAKFQKAIR